MPRAGSLAVVVLASALLAGCTAPRTEDVFSWRITGREPGLFAALNASGSPSVLRLAMDGPADALDAPNVRDALGPYRVSMVARTYPDGIHAVYSRGSQDDRTGDTVLVRAPTTVTPERLAEAVAEFVARLTLQDPADARSAGEEAAASWRANITPPQPVIRGEDGSEIHTVPSTEALGEARWPGTARLPEAFRGLGGTALVVEPVDPTDLRPDRDRTLELGDWSFALSLPSMQISLDDFEPGGAQVSVDAHDRIEGHMPQTSARTAEEAAMQVEALLAKHGLSAIPHGNWTYER